jgi:hypothetical protein
MKIVTERVVDTVRDTVVSIEADSSLIQALLECDSAGNVYVKQLLEYRAGKNLQPPQLSIHNNRLTAVSKTDSMGIYLQLHDKYREQNKTEVKTKTVTVHVNELYWWQKILIGLGAVFCILLFIAGYKQIKH